MATLRPGGAPGFGTIRALRETRRARRAEWYCSAVRRAAHTQCRANPDHRAESPSRSSRVAMEPRDRLHALYCTAIRALDTAAPARSLLGMNGYGGSDSTLDALESADGDPDQACKGGEENNRTGSTGNPLNQMLDPLFRKAPPAPGTRVIVQSDRSATRYRVRRRFHGTRTPVRRFRNRSPHPLPFRGMVNLGFPPIFL